MVKRVADDTAPAILQADPLKRLDAIIRRHGGKPKADTPPRRMSLPPVGKRSCKGQLAFDEVGDE